MRPDEHKKKKNTAYKKKHGISNKASDNVSDKKSKPKDEKNKTNVKNSDTHSIQSSQRASRADSSDSSASDSELVENKKTYRRREIVSNWLKYEVGPELDDGPVTSRGEDFNKLLNMAGEAMSHFRFREELEWDDDVKSGEGDFAEHDPLASSYLSLDLVDISSSISCIPIHKLLGIDQSLFPADQLETHTKSVEEKRSIYLKSVNERLQSNQPKEQIKKQTSKTSKNVCNLSSDSKIVPSNSHQSKHSDLEGLAKCNSDEIGMKYSEPSKLDMCKKLPANSSVPETDEDLSSPSKVSTEQSFPEASLSLQDDELDQLLDMDVSQEEKKDSKTKDRKINQSSAVSTEIKDEKKEAEELEDWLDSILD